MFENMLLRKHVSLNPCFYAFKFMIYYDFNLFLFSFYHIYYSIPILLYSLNV